MEVSKMVWDKDFANMEELMRGIMSDFFGESVPQSRTKFPLARCKVYPAQRRPRASLEETDKSVNVSIELAGVDKKDIELNSTPTELEIKVQKKQETQAKSKDCKSEACRSVQFYRRIGLPAEVNPDLVIASYKDGLLKVQMPKIKQPDQKKKIDIK
jgi:HSP20 family protein